MIPTDAQQFHMATLGCARNQVDSEIMLGRLAESGWTHTEDPSGAAVIVVNTCCFITDATNESIDAILETIGTAFDLKVSKREGQYYLNN